MWSFVCRSSDCCWSSCHSGVKLLLLWAADRWIFWLLDPCGPPAVWSGPPGPGGPLNRPFMLMTSSCYLHQSMSALCGPRSGAAGVTAHISILSGGVGRSPVVEGGPRPRHTGGPTRSLGASTFSPQQPSDWQRVSNLGPALSGAQKSPRLILPTSAAELRDLYPQKHEIRNFTDTQQPVDTWPLRQHRQQESFRLFKSSAHFLKL